MGPGGYPKATDPQQQKEIRDCLTRRAVRCDFFLFQDFTVFVFPPPPGGTLDFPVDGDDQRIFLGLKFSIPGFFWVGKFGKYLLFCVA